jgi:hypothetical protein
MRTDEFSMLWNVDEDHLVRQRQRVEIKIGRAQAIRPAARHAESGHALAARVAYGRKGPVYRLFAISSRARPA